VVDGVGHLHPAFGALQDDVAALLRAMVDTLIAPGERIVVGCMAP
jgi:hypothetical protein